MQVDFHGYVSQGFLQQKDICRIILDKENIKKILVLLFILPLYIYVPHCITAVNSNKSIYELSELNFRLSEGSRFE